MKHAIIIGASSGMGKELAKILSQHDYIVGLVAPEEQPLRDIANQLSGKSFVKTIDVRKTDDAMRQLHNLINEMGDVELIVISAGVGFIFDDTDWQQQKAIIDVNVAGFTAMCRVAIDYFVTKKRGHLVGFTSLAALYGMKGHATYCASKAYVSILLDGIRNSLGASKLPIHVTTIQPGYIDTPMIAGAPEKFWVSPLPAAARQIYDAIKKKKKHAYITRRWRIMAWLMKLSPDWAYQLLGF